MEEKDVVKKSAKKSIEGNKTNKVAKKTTNTKKIVSSNLKNPEETATKVVKKVSIEKETPQKKSESAKSENSNKKIASKEKK